jgi:hypothetical protein
VGLHEIFEIIVYKPIGLNWVGLIWTGRLEDVVKTPWVVGWRTNQARSVDQG